MQRGGRVGEWGEEGTIEGYACIHRGQKVDWTHVGCVIGCVCVPSGESFRLNSSGSIYQTWLSVRVRHKGHIKTLKSKVQPSALYD